MKKMRGLIVLLFAAIVFSSCQKNGVNPDTTASTTSATTSTTTATTATNSTSTTTTTDTAVILHTVKFDIKNQVAKTAVTDSTLNVTYNEDVALLICAKGYTNSYAITLKEDFTGSILSSFNFYSSSKAGVTTYNYIESNLNNVDFKTVTDTTVNNAAMKKVHVQRVITFTKRFATPALATAAKKMAMGLSNLQQVGYNSYMYYDKTYPVTSASARINYY